MPTDCTCDLDHYCGNHTDCPLCGREMPDVDQSEAPKLCRTCRATAKAAGGPYDPERHAAAWRFDRYGG